MKELENKLQDLENARECLFKCQVSLRERINKLIHEDQDTNNEETIYQKNKKELQDICIKMEILNNAIDILQEREVI